MFDVRRDHDPQRRLLQVLELREYERLRVAKAPTRRTRRRTEIHGNLNEIHRVPPFISVNSVLELL